MSYTAHEIAREIDSDVVGDSNITLTHVVDIENGGIGSLAFVASKQYLNQLQNTKASAVIVPRELVAECPVVALISSNPYLSFARAVKLLHPENTFSAGIHPSAIVHDECDIDDNVFIGPNVVISEKSSIGANSYIGAGTVITAPVTIGEGSRLIARVTITGPTVMGDRCIIHPGVVMASDGFGLANNKGIWEKIPQLGRVVLGDDVEVGANTAIDRGALKDTIIGNGVKIDNQVQIAHNVIIGDHTAVAGCAGIAGSAVIGKHCAIGAAAGIKGHITIADGVQISGMSAVRQSIDKPGLYSSGTALQENNSWLRNASRFKDISKIYKQVNQLVKKLEEMDKGK